MGSFDVDPLCLADQDGEEGTDGALLTLVPSGDVYDESANLISKGGK